MKAQVEQVTTTSRESFLCRNFVQERFDHPFHFHPEIEITYIERSRGTLIVGDYVGEFGPGELFLLGSNLPHIFRNTTASSNGAQSTVLHFARNCANGFLDAAPELRAVGDLFDRAGVGLRFDIGTARTARRILRKIDEGNGIRRWLHMLELVEVLEAAPSPRLLASAGFAGVIDLEGSPRMHDICQYVIEHFDEPLSLPAMARRTHLSSAHFSRQFKKTTRRTYTQFLTEVRLGHACRLLVETDLPVVHIAFASGFRNLSNFNRRFLAAYRCSPRQYRNRHHI